MFSGFVLNEFSLQDVCPFLARTGTGTEKACFVFPGGRYGTVESILSVKIYDWSNTIFYLVPFSIKVVQMLLIDASIADVLITNQISASVLEYINKYNVGKLGKNGINLAQALVNNVVTTEDHLNMGAVCQRNIPITRATIKLINDIITEIGEDTGGAVYTFTSLVSQATLDPTVTMTQAEVYPAWTETNVPVTVSGITIQPALTSADCIGGGICHIIYGPVGSAVTSRGQSVCTRFNVNAERFTITGNITFVQTTCGDTLPQIQQTPIIFSGTSAKEALITGISIVDGTIAVSFLGDNAAQYSYASLMDVSASNVYDITFIYNEDSPISMAMRNIYAVYALSVGIGSIAQCEESAVTPVETEKLSNCVIRYTPTVDTCLPAGTCLPGPILNNSNPCCNTRDGNPWPIVYNPVACLPTGWQCSHVTPLITKHLIPSQTPNNQILCNEAFCNCAISQVCAVLHKPNETFIGSQFQCNPTDVILRGVSKYNSTIIPSTVSYIQSWQYDTNGPTYGGQIYDSGTMGIGYQVEWWTLDYTDLAKTTTPQGLPLKHADYDANTTTRFYFAPTQTVEVAEYGDPVYISLQSDQVDFYGVGSTEFVDQYGTNISINLVLLDGIDRWCVTIDNNTHQLVLDACRDADGRFNTNISQFVISPTDARIHPKNNPYMCITGIDGALYLAPCTPCAIGTELHLTCGEALQNQWFYPLTPLSESETLLTSVQTNETYLLSSITSGSQYIIYSVNTLVLIYISPGVCITEDVEIGIIRPAVCNPCTWENTLQRASRNLYNTYCRDALGPIRLLCNTAHLSGLHGVLQGDRICNAPRVENNVPFYVDGAHLGIGAEGVCINGVFTLLKRGFGYYYDEEIIFTDKTTGQILNQDATTTYVAVTYRVFVQPYNNTNNFNLNVNGLEVINYTEISNITGQAIQVSVPIRVNNYNNMVAIICYVLLVIFILLFGAIFIISIIETKHIHRIIMESRLYHSLK